jgi:hypothetical protein
MKIKLKQYIHIFFLGFLISFLAIGCKGSTGSAGLSTGSITGSVVDTFTDKPLAGALITTSPLSFSTTTDVNGNFAIQNLPIGIYQVTASLSGYISQTTGYISIVAGKTTTIPFKLSSVPLPSTMVVANAGKDQWAVGYGSIVTIDGSASTSASGKPLTYTWTQVPNYAGQMIAAPVTFLNGTNSPVLKVQLPTLQQFLSSLDVPVQIPDRFGMLGISAWLGGGNFANSNDFAFQLTVSDGTNTSTTTVYVSPASITSGLTNVPVGITQYLNGGTNGGTQTSWNWQIISTPAGSNVTTLTNPTSQTPSFTPDLPGQYVFFESVSGQELTVNAGTYVGWQQCAQCHSGNISNAPNTVNGWLGTKHATIFTRMINGDYQDDDNYTLHCVGCHTLGDTPEETSHNNGWWDAYIASGWLFPFVANNYSYPINYNNWNNMPQSLKNMSNVQCENCHGPGSVHTGSFSYNQAVCFQCHDDTDDEDTANEWRTSAHAQSLTAAGGLVTKNLNCVKCHVSQEIVAVNFEGQTPTVVTDPYPINCVACHDPHDATNPNDLRLYGSETIAGGSFTLTNIGAGAICTMCHTDGVSNPNTAIQYALSLTGTSSAASAATSATTVHEPTAEIFAAGQGFTLVGAGAYAATVQSSPHASGALYSGSGQNLCVTCHMYNPSYFTVTTGNHSFAMSDGINDDTEACAQCHTVGYSNGAQYTNVVTGFDTWVDPVIGPVPNWDGSPLPPCPTGNVCTSGTEGIQDRVQGLLSVLACAITTSSTPSNPGTCTANTVDINGNPVVWQVTIPATRGIANVISPSNGTAGFTFTNTFTRKELDAVYNYNLVANEGSTGIHNTRFDVELLQKAFYDLTGANVPNATLY